VALFGDANADGILSAQEDAALHVTLNATDDDLASFAANGADFSNAGIDEVSFKLGNGADLENLLGQADKLADLNLQNLDFTVDFGGVHVDLDALHLGARGEITLDAEGASQGTHLSTSLKDLQKLGVDAVSVAGDVSEISIDLGTGAAPFTFEGGSVVNFEGDSDLRVTLNTQDASQLDNIADFAGNLQDAGIDAVMLDLSGQGNLDTVLGAGTLSRNLDDLEFELAALRLGDLQSILGIDQAQAGELLANGLSFEANDTILLNASVDASQGTHLSTSLKDLQ
jgi:hypothetical protein